MTKQGAFAGILVGLVPAILLAVVATVLAPRVPTGRFLASASPIVIGGVEVQPPASGGVQPSQFSSAAGDLTLETFTPGATAAAATSATLPRGTSADTGQTPRDVAGGGGTSLGPGGAAGSAGSGGSDGGSAVPPGGSTPRATPTPRPQVTPPPPPPAATPPAPTPPPPAATPPPPPAATPAPPPPPTPEPPPPTPAPTPTPSGLCLPVLGCL